MRALVDQFRKLIILQNLRRFGLCATYVPYFHIENIDIPTVACSYKKHTKQQDAVNYICPKNGILFSKKWLIIPRNETKK